jgi:tetratricopeptide (TPR) repeat protein
MELIMSPSGILFALGWIFTFLTGVFSVLLTAISQKWIKNSILTEFASDPSGTMIVTIFLGFLAAVSFILSHFLGTAEEKRIFENLKTEIIEEFSDISTPLDKNKVEKIIEVKGIKLENFLKLLSKGTVSDQGLKLLYENDYDGAIKKFKEATQGNGKDFGINWLNIGNAYFFTGEYNKASDAYENSTKSNPHLKAAWHNWGAALSKQGLYDRAIEKFQHVEKMDSLDDSNLVNWGATLGDQGKFDDAIQKFKQALNLNPESCKTFYNWGLVLGKMSKYDEAFKKYQSAVDLCPGYGAAWSNMGWCLEKQNDYKGAIEIYDKALEIRPEHARTWSNLGWSFVKLERYDKATNSFEKAISYDGSLDDTLCKWGWVLSELGRIDEAIEKYWHAVGINPNNEGAWINLCSLISFHKTSEVADKAYAEAVKNIPNSALLWLNWGTSMVLRADIKGSIEKFRIASEYNPSFAPIWSNWSLALTAIGKPEEALEKIEIAVKIEPNNAGNLINYGKILRSLGREEEALQKFEKAKQLGGKILESKDGEDAIHLFLRTLPVDADDLKSYSPKEKEISAIEEHLTDAQMGTQKVEKNSERQLTQIKRPYISLEPIRNEEGIYWTVEKNKNIANIIIDFELKNSGSVSANNITFPNSINVRSKMNVQAVHKLTPIITLIPDDSVKLRFSMQIDFENPDDILTEINHMNSNKFLGYTFGFNLAYENELDATKKYVLSVLYIIKKDYVMVLKLEDRHI